MREPISNLCVRRILLSTPQRSPPPRYPSPLPTRYGFTPGSTLAITPKGYAATAARATICTTLSAAFGGMVTVLATKKLDHIWDLGALCNGILAGLVSITAGCATVLPWHAMLIGIIGGLVYLGGSRLELKFKVSLASSLLDTFNISSSLRCSLAPMFCCYTSPL